MFDWVLNTPLVVIKNISVQNFLLMDKGDKVFKNGPSKICGRQPLKNVTWYFVPNVFAFGQLKRYAFRCSLLKVSNKTGVGKNQRTSKHIAFIVLGS